MGVPTFYRWLCSRFPKVPKDITSNKSGERDSEFDAAFGEFYHNLYLDMNGIVHPCCHPEDLPQPTSEDEMFEAIFDYIDRLVEIIKPRRLLYLALDGVAPRAKMNQQRSRRFKAVYEREYAQKQLENAAKGESQETSSNASNSKQHEQEKGWDSNVITPGTPFMYQLGLKLEDYVLNRLEHNEIWHNIAVIISDSNSPGEGEHKIMHFIRVQRQSPNYDPNTRHVIHGMDADLIMLALATHEPNFFILREVVFLKQFTAQPASEPEESSGVVNLKFSQMVRKAWKPLQILQIPVLREYLSHVFKDCGNDLERCIDDLVLMCFFCGNDFLPHLPSMSITLGSIDQMIYLYQQIFPTLKGYLTDGGRINMEQLAIFTSYLTAVEHETLCLKSNNHGNRRQNAQTDNGAAGAEEEHATKTGIDVSSGPPEMYKSSYYMKKLACSEEEVEQISSAMADEYVKGMEWVLEYYYQGIPSWNWYYPYHYAPFASDLKFSKPHTFELGTPFTPIQQLMSVLPVQSSHCLPEKFAELMRDEESPIAEYYPRTLRLDPNGARYRYQWIALLPFIDEKLLLATVEPLEHELNDEESKRNELRSERVFVSKNSYITKYLNDKIGESANVDLPIHIGNAIFKSTSGSTQIYSFGCDKSFRHSSKLLKGVRVPAKYLEIGDLMDESRSRGFNCQVAKRMISHYINLSGEPPRNADQNIQTHRISHYQLPSPPPYHGQYQRQRQEQNYQQAHYYQQSHHYHNRSQQIQNHARDGATNIGPNELLGGYSLKRPNFNPANEFNKKHQNRPTENFEGRDSKRYRM